MTKDNKKVIAYTLAVSMIFTLASQHALEKRMNAILPKKQEVEVYEEEEDKKFPKLKKHR